MNFLDGRIRSTLSSWEKGLSPHDKDNPMSHHKCFICEKGLPSVSVDASDPGKPGQSYGGGEVRMTFDYGSRYDWMGSMEPVRGGPSRPMTILGRAVEYQDIVDRKPRDGALHHESKAVRLSSCKYIIGDICDDCFESRSHLLKGYEKNEKGDLVPLVE